MNTPRKDFSWIQIPAIPARIGVVVVLSVLIMVSELCAQNFNNTGGSYRGSGLFRVRSQAIGLPDTVTGTFEYFGSDTQRVNARNYEHLLLSGNGSTKQTVSDVNIIHSVAVADGVKYQVISSTMTLEKVTGRITREEGLISGRVTKSVDFTSSSDSSDFGGIGLSIRSQGPVLGTTDIVRTSGTSVTGQNGNRSIQRVYDVAPANSVDAQGSLYFHYAKDELAGNDSLTLEMWRSPDNGSTWRRQHTIHRGNGLVRTGKNIQGLWTAAAANNLIGRSNYEFDPDSILAVSSDSLKGKVNRPLDSLFIVQIYDIFGNPITGENVRFEITSVPTNALGQSLTEVSVVTNALGQASTQLTFGNRAGRYVVTAYVESMPATRKDFDGYAGSMINALLPNSAPVQDSIKQIVGPFIVDAFDETNAHVANTGVRFRIIPPQGSPASRQMIVQADTATDASGQARAMVQLGEKTGVYTVEVRSTENDTLMTVFTINATHGFPAIAWKDTLSRRDTIGTLIPEFTYAITDGDTNAVPGRNVRYALMQPDSSIIDSAYVITDSLGRAKAASFRYGIIAGTYYVSAEDASLPGSKLYFTCTALQGAARMLAQYSGNGQVGQIGDQLQPFVVRVTDVGGNAVPNTTVYFSIVEKTDTLAKYDSLSAYSGITDAQGFAYTQLTLGDRQGKYSVRAFIPGVKDTLFAAYAVMLLADANHDNYRNIGDLTAMVDHAIGRRVLSGYDFNKSDMYPKRSNGIAGDGFVDIRDVQVCLDSLLHAGWDPTKDWVNVALTPLFKSQNGTFASRNTAPIPVSTTDSCYIQTTHIGSRVWLKNAEPIKGMQVVLYTKEPLQLDTTDLVYSRARMMSANIQTIGNEVNIVLWNLGNTPIEAGDSILFRLPVQLTENNLDSIKVMISKDSNVVSMVASKQMDIRNLIPRDWVLYQNYPNPFNPSTTIEFDVPEVANRLPRVMVQIFNVLGQKVRTIERGVHGARRYSVTWDGKSDNGVQVASGVYFYRMMAGEFSSTKKMVLVK